ncbi:hypothetical protein V6N13_048010 [Hibiscus sabdariffa]|uniref:Uncharacterized protein n=1 Tax=Hibiscus sabdariffa TaxID=183260 RepID=A0ABR2F5Z1_9ROSI
MQTIQSCIDANYAYNVHEYNSRMLQRVCLCPLVDQIEIGIGYVVGSRSYLWQTISNGSCYGGGDGSALPLFFVLGSGYLVGFFVHVSVGWIASTGVNQFYDSLVHNFSCRSRWLEAFSQHDVDGVHSNKSERKVVAMNDQPSQALVIGTDRQKNIGFSIGKSKSSKCAHHNKKDVDGNANASKKAHLTL